MKKIHNPLTIIGMFACIAEVAGTTALPFVNSDLQKIFIWYVMGFPILLVILFFITLNLNPKVLYAPSDFEDENNFMALLANANDALTNVIDENPNMEEALKPVEHFIENIPTNSDKSNIKENDDIICAWSSLNIYIGKLEYEDRTFYLAKDKNIIGKSKEADIWINYSMISRKHCLIYRMDGKYFIKDLASTNGTYVNDEKVNIEKELKNNDIIKLGYLELNFILEKQTR